MENKFNDKKFISIDDLTIENIQELYDCEYDLEIAGLIVCADCGYVMQEDDVVNDVRTVDGFEDYWDYHSETPEQRDVEYEEEFNMCPICEYGSDEGQEFESYPLTIDDLFNKELNGLSDYTGNEFVEALETFKAKLNETKKTFKKGEIKLEGKQNLQEATIKALYDGLKDDEEVKDVEGLVSDILVVTDPEITTDEYNELIERAQEIVEETPEGDIPLDPTYLGEYLQICPICGGSFIEDHILEPGTACPICYETPESYVMVGKLQSEDDVAEDNGLVDDAENKPTLNIDGEEPVELNSDETEIADLGDVENEPKEELSDANEEPTPERIRGARFRRNRDLASKEIPEGNILVESKEQDDDNKEDLALKEEYLNYIKETIEAGTKEQGLGFEEWLNNKTSKLEETDDEEPEDVRYKVSFYVDSTQTSKADIKDILSDALKGTGLASIKEDIEIEIDEIYEEDVEADTDKELLLGSESESEEKDYTLTEIDTDKIQELVSKSAFTWEGMDISDENLKAIVTDLKEKTPITLPVNFYTFSGKTMNDLFGLTDKNAYSDDLHFVSIDLDNWSEMGNLPMYKMEVNARWLDDIVGNNKVRQDAIDGIDVDAEDEE